jgi:AcrR family transcriptional regulator
LVAIAARLIGQHGFDATSIKAIATAAGVSTGTVQHHFPNKGDLWAALVDEVIAPAMRSDAEAAAAATDGAVSIDDAVTRSITARIEAAVTRPGLSAAILLDASPQAEHRLAVILEAMGGQRDQVLQTMEMLVASGQLRPFDPRSLAALISIGLAALSSAPMALKTMLGIDLDDPAQRQRLITDLTQIVLRGVLPTTTTTTTTAAPGGVIQTLG